MGREVFAIITDNEGKRLWTSDTVIYGRNSETNALFRFVEDGSDGLIDISTTDQRQAIRDCMDEFSDERLVEYNRINEDLEDLRDARRHAVSMDAFRDFSAAIEDLRVMLDDGCWHRAQDINDLVDSTRRAARHFVDGDVGDLADFTSAGIHLYLVWSD